MGLQKKRALAIAGFVQNKVELVDIPTELPVKELRFQLEYEDSGGGWTVTGDPFNLIFQSVQLIFNGEVQYKIENLHDLQIISALHTGRKADVEVIDDTNVAPSEKSKINFTIPVMWKSAEDGANPQLRMHYVNAANPDSTRTSITVIQTADTSDFVRFKLVKISQGGTSGGSLYFKPEQDKIVRGAFIYCQDASQTDYTAGQNASLDMFGGNIGISTVALKHGGVEYDLTSTEEDLLDHTYDIYPLLGRVYGYDSNNVNGGFNVETYSWDTSPFSYRYQSADVGGDGIPAASTGYGALQTWLYMSFEDLKSDANTLLTINCETDANLTGSWAGGDNVVVTFVYKVSTPQKAI